MAETIVFMGSPDFALPSLKALADHYPVLGVVTQPDRPAGRGQKLTSPPVKLLAESLGIPVIQPKRLREPDAMQQLRAWAPQAIVVAAFGQILRPEVLDLPPFGCINVHASLLPRWRGAAPVQACLLAGDEHTGVTIMQMDPGLDTGPMLSQRPTPILATDTAGSLTDRLAQLGADLLIQTLPDYFEGLLTAVPQPAEFATYAPRLEKSAGELDFTQPVEVLARQVRAFSPWPGAFTTWQGQLLKIQKAYTLPAPAARPGITAIQAGLPAFGAAGGWLVIEELQPAGKRSMSGAAFLQGVRQWSS